MQQKNGNLSRVSVFFFGKEREKCARGHARIPLPEEGRLEYARRRIGNNSAGRPMVAPTLCDSKGFALFPALYNFSARSATCNYGKGKHAVFD